MNNFSVPSLIGPRVVLVASLLLVAGCSSSTVAPPAASSAKLSASGQSQAPTAPGAFNDDPRPQTAHEAAVAAAALDPAKLAALERKLLALVLDPASEPAAAQDAAQQLGFVALAGSPKASAATLDALAPLLADPARVDLARLVLDLVPGPQIDALYLRALPTAIGRARLGLIDALGSRRIADAVPALAAQSNDSDAATASAALSALGKIGGAPALAALDRAAQPLAPAVLNARLAAAAQTDAATSAQVAAEIYRNAQVPLAQRSAALRQLITADPANAVTTIDAALSSSEPAFHAVALESVATLAAPDSVVALADRLGNYPAAVQVRLVTALGHSGEADAVPGVLSLLASPEAPVRLATISALGRLPANAEVTEELAAIARSQSDEAKAALNALTRLDGPGVDRLVQQAAADPTRTDADRAVFIQLLGTRNLTEAIPFLLSLRGSPAASLRLEALDALRAIAAPADQAAVIAWATGATDRTEQNRAVRALITTILRDGAVDTRAAPVVAALESGNASARLILMPVLSRVAGSPALKVAAELARDPDPAVAAAANAELSRWPDASVLPVLVKLAKNATSEQSRATTVQGAARFLTQTTDVVRENRSTYTRTLLRLPLTTSAKQTLLNVLSLCADQAALDTAREFLTDTTVAATAQDAVDAITSNLAGPALVTTSAEPAKAALLTDGKLNTFWQAPGEVGTWVQIDLHHPRPVRKIALLHGSRSWGYPASFDVQVSDNPEQPGAVVAQGEGQKDLTVVNLPAGTRGRYVWLRVTAERDAPVAIAEIRIE